MGLPDLGRLMAAGLSAGEALAVQDQLTELGTATPPSLGGGSLNPQGNVFTFAGSAGNGADTTEDTLATYSLPANALNAVGKGVYIYAWGSYTSGNTMHANLYFGASKITASTGTTGWALEMVVMKSAANAQNVNGQLIADSTHSGVTNIAGTDADNAAIVIKCTGQDTTSAVANRVVLKGMYVNFMN